MQTEISSTSTNPSNKFYDSYILPLESGKAVSLTMNIPQHSSSISKMELIEENQLKDSISKQNLHRNHITTDPKGCLDCISTMFGPGYAPFAVFSTLFIFKFSSIFTQ